MKIPPVFTKLFSNKLFSNKYFLYVVVVLSVLINFGYLYSMRFNAMAFFFLVGLIMVNFSKNLAIVLSVCLAASTLLSSGLFVASSIEGYTNDDTVKTDVDTTVEPVKTDKEKEPVTATATASKTVTKTEKLSGTELNGASSLDDLLDPNAIKNLTAETMELMGEQKKLFATMNDMGPLLSQAKEMMDGFDMKQLNSLAKLTAPAGTSASASAASAKKGSKKGSEE
jgi:hypothetical protein